MPMSSTNLSALVLAGLVAMYHVEAETGTDDFVYI